jgi:hypothetical protein
MPEPFLTTKMAQSNFLSSAAKTLLFIIIFASSILAQERFLPSVAGINTVNAYQNASALDGVSATMPSPVNCEYLLYFDLGYWLPPNTSITLNIHGDIPEASNLLIGAIYDEPKEGFSHRTVIAVPNKARVDNNYFEEKITTVILKYPFAVRHFCLIRHTQQNSYTRHPDGTITGGEIRAENGKDVTIDALAEMKVKPVISQSWGYRNGRAVINANNFGKTLKQ